MKWSVVLNYARRFSSNEFDRRDLRGKEEKGRKGQRRSVQDYILGRCRSKKIPLEVQLKNELVIVGKIIAFDNWTIFLDEGKGNTLIFKSGILSLKPLKPLDIGSIISYPSESDIDLKDKKSPYLFEDRDIA